MRPGFFLLICGSARRLGGRARVAQPPRAPGVLPLDRILPGIRRAHPGQFYDADGPTPGPDGSEHYHLKWMTPDGRIEWLDTDARTGRVLGASPGRDTFDGPGRAPLFRAGAVLSHAGPGFEGGAIWRPGAGRRLWTRTAGHGAAAAVAAMVAARSGVAGADGTDMRILLVEDDKDLQRLLKKALGDAGYVVDTATDGEEGHFLGDTEPYDAVVLDLGLPKMDGVRVLEKWRKAGKKMPVLILTARDRWSDKVAGFDAGADDYLAKPFYTEELLARLRALLRRAAGFATADIEIGPLRIDTRASRVTLDGNPVKLTSLEYRLLAYLAHHRGKVVSRTELVEHLYDQDFDRDSNTIEVFVGRLRKKLDAGLIQTVRGLGYSLEDPALGDKHLPA